MKQNEPAFPCAAMDAVEGTIYQEGLTKREWFAGMALQGLLANPNGRAEAAVYYADALIKELEKDKPLPTAEEYFSEYKDEK